MMSLQMNDAEIFEDRAIIHLCRSKTDQVRKGQFITLLHCWLVEVCPFRALLQYSLVRGLQQGPLFSHQNGCPLTKFQFWALTSKALDKARLSGWKFGTHSFQIGAESMAAALGYTQEQIKGVGRWSSRAFWSYMQPLPQ